MATSQPARDRQRGTVNFRNISAWAIRNPIPPIVLFVALTIAGIMSFARMDVNDEPDIDFPIAVVVIAQPGAAPSELETQVTRRVEAAVRSLQGIDEITSTVTESSSQTVVQLAIGTSIDRAVNDVRDAIAQIRGDLPEGILEPQVFRANTTDRDLASYSALTTDMTEEQLSWYVDNVVAKTLLSVPGLAKVNRNGGVDREIRVMLDPAALQSFGITAAQVNQQLCQVNTNAAGGRAEIAGAEQSIRVVGNATSVYDLAQTQIAIGGGRTVRLADLGRVRDLYAERRGRAAVDGGTTVSFDIQRSKGASDVTVFREAERRLAALENRNPKVRFAMRQNTVKYTEQQYESAIHAMIEGAVLAVLVVLLFLRDWRATLISALAIPLSIVPSFFLMDLVGFSLNSMTLVALSLVAGVLVDDAIVEIENIVRHMDMGKSAYEASIDAADEIGLAVLGTTMAIVAVFLPVALMPGVAGQYFKNFGLTVVMAVLMSLAVARLITPMLAAYFLKASGPRHHADGPVMHFYIRVLRWSLRSSRPQRAHGRGWLRRGAGALRDHRIWLVGVGAMTFVMTLAMFAILPGTFQPPRDNDTSTASIEMVPGTTLPQTEAVVSRVAALLRRQPDVTSVYARTFVGSGRVIATLRDGRMMASTEFERQLAPSLAAIPDARVSFRSQFGWGAGGRDLTVVLGGEDPELLARTAQRIVGEMATLPMLQSPRVAGDLQRPEIVIRPRFDLAATFGVTTAALSNAVRVATLGDIDQNSARYSLSDRQVPLRVALDQAARTSWSTIKDLPVPTQTGGSVPLGVVAEIGLSHGPTKIERLDQQRQITLGADFAPGVVSGEVQARVDALLTLRNLPVGVAKLDVGATKWMQEMIVNFMTAVAAGVSLVFAVLVLLYRRLLPPLVNLGSLLLAPLGGLLALWIAGQPISMPVYIGILLLLGIVAKNSILLIDFALGEVERGVDPVAAIIDAGHKRARPIVMTTVAMVAGMIPAALSLNGDGSFNMPMGLTVIGGLTLSTLLTLLIVPATFSLAIGIEGWIGPRLGRRLLTYRPNISTPGLIIEQ